MTSSQNFRINLAAAYPVCTINFLFNFRGFVATHLPPWRFLEGGSGVWQFCGLSEQVVKLSQSWECQFNCDLNSFPAFIIICMWRTSELFHISPLFSSDSHVAPFSSVSLFLSSFSNFTFSRASRCVPSFPALLQGFIFPRLQPAACFCTGHRLLLFSLLCCLLLFWLARLAKGLFGSFDG